jgi:hypothetical protein
LLENVPTALLKTWSALLAQAPTVKMGNNGDDELEGLTNGTTLPTNMTAAMAVNSTTATAKATMTMKRRWPTGPR